MSVLTCDRNNCTNIMCDKLSDEFGYICDECFEELVNKGFGTNVQEFMDSPKLKYSLYKGLTRDFFNQIFCERK